MHAPAYAKINLGLVVGPLRDDGKHEIATVLERVDLHDLIELEPAPGDGIFIEGFVGDTLVRRALELFDAAVDSSGGWRVRIEKRIPLASGLGGGSSDAAAALRLGNESLHEPLSPTELHELAAEVGSDVPFFLTAGAKLATGDGTTVEPVALPCGYWIVLALARSAQKESTAAVYDAFDASSVARPFAAGSSALREAAFAAREPRDLAPFPLNQLVAPDPGLGDALATLGAFRVDTSGAGPTVYGLFEAEEDARKAASSLRQDAETWLARPAAGP
jgi:4-diphosphocytidyl-2-C-methyl-D-erythritol kinase